MNKNNKNKKKCKTTDKKNRYIPILRTEEERSIECRQIINKLTELQLTISYEPIKELFIILQNYKKNGKKTTVNIAFPMINKRIKGILSDTLNEDCWIKLEHENF